VVSESFNNMSEFVRFATEGYLATFALDEFGLASLEKQTGLTSDDLRAASQSIRDNLGPSNSKPVI